MLRPTVSKAINNTNDIRKRNEVYGYTKQFY